MRERSSASLLRHPRLGVPQRRQREQISIVVRWLLEAQSVRVEPHVAVQIGVAGLEPEVGADQLLKVGAFLPLGQRSDTVLGKDVLKCARHAPLLSGCRG